MIALGGNGFSCWVGDPLMTCRSVTRRHLCPGPFCNAVIGVSMFAAPKNKWMLVVCRMLRMLLTTFSGTVMTSATLNDIYRSIGGPTFLPPQL